MIRKSKIRFGKKDRGWVKPVIIIALAAVAFFLGFLLGKPIMDIFR